MSTNTTKKIQINKRVKGLPREELEKLEKSELIDKILQLEAYNFQLKNILKKKLNEKQTNNDEYVQIVQEVEHNRIEQQSKKMQKKRTFDFTSAHSRHVLLKVLYFGWDYQGFAIQENSNETIEHYLFEALTRTCLIQSRENSNYHRCGRTDKEVSAFSQVISIDLRSKFPQDVQLSAACLSEEIDYCGLLNRVLPRNIQCVAWMPLGCVLYSARFDCASRTYRYYFPRSNLNLTAMQNACSLLQQHTDFRNFCKMDVHNGVTNYVRSIESASMNICPCETEDETGYTMYYLQIRANAFLWHQIRCIMAVLLLVGQGKEQPNVISDLLDIKQNPCKPQYTPAIGLPLNLFDCQFRKRSTRSKMQTDDASESVTMHAEMPEEETETDIFPWIYSQENLEKVIENVQAEWTQFNIKATMTRNVLHCLEQLLTKNFNVPAIKKQEVMLQDCLKSQQYINLLNRTRCESLENRIEHFVKKQRLVMTNAQPCDE